MSNEHGIKETMELLDGLKILGVAGIKVSKGDGLDEKLAGILELAAQATALVEATKDVALAVDEVKELSLEEMQTVMAKLYEVSDALREAMIAVQD